METFQTRWCIVDEYPRYFLKSLQVRFQFIGPFPGLLNWEVNSALAKHGVPHCAFWSQTGIDGWFSHGWRLNLQGRDRWETAMQPWNQYLYLVVNVKGIVLAEAPFLSETLIQLLSRKFRYRKIGVVWGEGKKDSSFPRLRAEPFVELPFPFDRSALGIDSPGLLQDVVLKCLMFCGVYLSPWISLFNRQYSSGVLSDRPRPFSLENLRLDDADLKFNLRLGDYIMTDVAHHFMQQVYERLFRESSIAQEKLERFMALRFQAIQEDGKTRFWRLLENPTPGNKYTLAIHYIDPLPLFLRMGWLNKWVRFAREQKQLRVFFPLLTGPVVNIQIDV